jgi:ribosomal protein S18 acetylase RimI-like enzyme
MTSGDTTKAYEVLILGPDRRDVLRRVADGVFDRGIDATLADEFLSDPRHHLAAAIADGELIGFASGVHYVHPDKPPELWINEVGVSPAHQGRGVGKAVVRALLEHGCTLGCREAWVLTDGTNDAAMRLYASAGGRVAPGETVMFEFDLR